MFERPHLPIRFFETHRVGEIMSRFGDLSASLGAASRLLETSLVLHDITLEIAAGTSLAIVGPSGAGKSSLLRQICGLEHPATGMIHADEVPLHTIPLVDLRRQTAVVWQEVALTRGTIRDNLMRCAPAALMT